MANIILHVGGMHCGLCVTRIERVLREIGSEGKVDLESATVTIVDDRSTFKFEKIKEAIEDLGYTVK